MSKLFYYHAVIIIVWAFYYFDNYFPIKLFSSLAKIFDILAQNRSFCVEISERRDTILSLLSFSRFVAWFLFAIFTFFLNDFKCKNLSCLVSKS